MQPQMKRAPVKDSTAVHKRTTTTAAPPLKPQQPPTQYLYPREPPHADKFSDVEIKPHQPQQQSTYYHQRSSNSHQHNELSRDEPKSRRSSVTSRGDEEEVKPILMRTRPFYDPQRFRDAFHGEVDDSFAVGMEKNVEQRLSPKHEPVRRTTTTAAAAAPALDKALGTPMLRYEKHSYIMKQHQQHEDEDLRPSSRHAKVESIRENLTDKQKYLAEQKLRSRQQVVAEASNKIVHEEKRTTASSLEKFMLQQQSPVERDVPLLKSSRYSNSNEMQSLPTQHHHQPHHQHNQQHFQAQPPTDSKEVRYRTNNDEFFFERNPYRERESEPYHESIENMMKSPVMRYKSFDDEQQQQLMRQGQSRPPSGEKMFANQNGGGQEQRYQTENSRRGGRPSGGGHLSDDVSVDLMKMKVSPQDRFRDAREKFQQMEKDRYSPATAAATALKYDSNVPQKQHHQKVAQAHPQPPTFRRLVAENPGGPAAGGIIKRIDPMTSSSSHHINSLQRQRSHNSSSNGTRGSSSRRGGQEWSSDEEHERDSAIMAREMQHAVRGYRELPSRERYPGLDRNEMGPSSRLAPAKSLGNLMLKRHSYAEPPNMMPRSGRVGLAAVNPY